jgi:hypothetical protein
MTLLFNQAADRNDGPTEGRTVGAASPIGVDIDDAVVHDRDGTTIDPLGFEAMADSAGHGDVLVHAERTRAGSLPDAPQRDVQMCGRDHCRDVSGRGCHEARPGRERIWQVGVKDAGTAATHLYSQ